MGRTVQVVADCPGTV